MRKGQLKTFEQAIVTPKQHKTPCADCPWGRISIPGWVGSTTPEEWIQQVHGEAYIDCHTKISVIKPWQCAGAAIYRANVAKLPRDPALLTLRGNRKLVFISPKEFLEHHKKKATP